MVGTLGPLAIFVGVSATVALVFYSIWSSFNARATQKARGLSQQLDRAAISMKPQEIVLTVSGCVALVWIALVVLLRPPVILAILILPVIAFAGAGMFYSWVKFKIERRLSAFITQLELALRVIASGIRVGLGLRQALTIVTEELPDPARHEFLRVIGQTNIGVSVLDALDDLAERMPSNETLMMARVIRIQSQSGGDLARILEQLAGTIKARRQVVRKISALTAEGRMSAIVLLSIPIALGLFITTTQPQYGGALLHSFLGHVVIGIILGLELVGYFWLRALMKVNV
ncbi:MAG TPA: type II secretion system F family protein [Candidatus Tumulicola sp.]|jgi:tight adherence protein B